MREIRMSERAAEIAQKHIQHMNPSFWNGLNEPPTDFDSRAITYPIGEGVELRISFEYEITDGWIHFCELRESDTGKLLNALHGYGIDSPQNLADTIEDTCECGDRYCQKDGQLQHTEHPRRLCCKQRREAVI